jgi:uncharacterized membrane protein
MNINEQIDQNVEAVRELERRVDQALDPAALRFKMLATRIGQPNVLRAIIATIIIWMLINLFADRLGFKAFDPFPFGILQGLIGLSSLMTSLIVLTGQNRESVLEGKRAHLDLQLSLLAEQKTTKLIALLEELRRDLPSVDNRHDHIAEGMQESANPEAILGAMSEQTSSA